MPAQDEAIVAQLAQNATSAALAGQSRHSTSRFWLTPRRKDRKGRQILLAFLPSLRENRELLKL
jgi:hypothetical protein